MSINVPFDTTPLQYAPWRAYVLSSAQNPEVSQEAYRPSQWNSEGVQTIIIDEESTQYVFDAILRLDHIGSRRITEHPVQSGANITDHSFRLPSSLSLEIGMSDVMGSYKLSQWEDGESRSVAAYLQIMEWKNSGKPLSIFTRLDDYDNMVVEHVSTTDTVKTKHGLRCIVTFRQIITAEVSLTEGDSSIKHVNKVNNLGSKTPIAPDTRTGSLIYEATSQ